MLLNHWQHLRSLFLVMALETNCRRHLSVIEKEKSDTCILDSTTFTNNTNDSMYTYIYKHYFLYT